MKNFFKNKYVKHILIFALGATVGYVVYSFTKCTTGTCPLKSHPYFYMLLFGLLGTSFIKSKK